MVFRLYIIAFKVKVAHWKCLHYCSSRFALAAIMRAFSMLDFNFKSNYIFLVMNFNTCCNISEIILRIYIFFRSDYSMWTKYSSIISFVIDNDDVTAYLEQYNDLRLQNVLCTISERPKTKQKMILLVNVDLLSLILVKCKK